MTKLYNIFITWVNNLFYEPTRSGYRKYTREEVKRSKRVIKRRPNLK